MKCVSLISLITAVVALTSQDTAYAIKKCQDADGKWHYGDIAVAACKQSKITTLDKRGFIASERDAPKTEEELEKEREEKAKADAEAKRIRDEQNERNRILSVYETEADIDRQRDNQVNSVQSNIAVHKAYLKSMRTKIVRLQEKVATAKGFDKEQKLKEIAKSEERIKESTIELKELITHKEQIVQRFAREKEVYRELKNQG